MNAAKYWSFIVSSVVGVVVAAGVATPTVAAARGGGRAAATGGPARVQNAHTSISNNQNRNVNMNANVNRNVNVNVHHDVDVHGGYGYGYDGWGHPVATAAAVTTAALVIGTVVASLPSSGCTAVVVGGVGYQHCGSTYYQPSYSGGTVNYTVVNPPH